MALSKSPFTLRVFSAGLLLCLLISAATPYTNILGFAICTVSFIVGRLWFSVFLAWLFKMAVLKYGGSRLHRMVCPFFMGLILGQFSNAEFWLIVAGFTGTTGNGIGVLFR